MPTAAIASICPCSAITAPPLPKPVKVHAVTPMGYPARRIGVRQRSGIPFKAVLAADQLAARGVMTDRMPFDRGARKFRYGIKATPSGVTAADLAESEMTEPEQIETAARFAIGGTLLKPVRGYRHDSHLRY